MQRKSETLQSAEADSFPDGEAKNAGCYKATF